MLWDFGSKSDVGNIFKYTAYLYYIKSVFFKCISYNSDELQLEVWIITYIKYAQSVKWSEMNIWKDEMKCSGFEPVQICTQS